MLTGQVRHHVETPKHVLVILHGMGDNADIIQLERFLRPYLNDKMRSELVIAAPNAPYPALNDWLVDGYQWFDINYDEAAQTFELGEARLWQESGAKLMAYLQKLSAQLNVSLENFTIAGFSQGAMMTLFTIPQLSSQVAGCIALAGRVLEEAPLVSAKQKPPFLIIHGAVDDVVPAADSKQAHELLQANGFESELLLIPGAGHDNLFNEQVLQRIAAFINEKLS